MLNPEDMDKLFTEEGNIIGYLHTDSGGILLIDNIWRDIVPKTDGQISLELDGASRQRIPVKALRKENKRFLVLSLDEGLEINPVTDTVKTNGSCRVIWEDGIRQRNSF